MIKVEGIFCGYNEFSLSDISFNVERGEIFGIIGPNGSGKTTLLRAISKVIPLKKGRVVFEEKDIRKMGFKEFAKMTGVVSQIEEIAFDMRVEDLVMLGRIPHQRFLFTTKKDTEVIEKSMEITGIMDKRKKYISKLSGGERQLVFISRALASCPRILLLDEPTTHLDITHQIEVLNLVRKLNKEMFLTVIIVLHDLNLASEYCDRLILLSGGKIYNIGSPEEVLTYQAIEDVYKTRVIVRENPMSHKPYVFLVSK
ncbi:MAG: ABC transporter ATP-binding protein [bacterium]